VDGLPPQPLVQQERPQGCFSDTSPAQAEQVLGKARLAFPNTSFVRAWPSCLPGMTALKLANGSVAYMDKSARYLMLGLVLDSATGQALDRQLDGHTE
jgi:uncharacterized protein YecA (UPF0149 family)